MLLRDLFESNGDMIADLRQQVIDYLIPMVSHNIDFVTIQDIEDTLQNSKSGLTVDRGLIMQVIDPTKLHLIKKVEGDKVYLSVTSAMTSLSSDDEQQKAADQLNNKATQQALKSIKS